jgi:hypothetical protein
MPITDDELHKLVAKLSVADKRRLLKVLRSELARLAQDGRLRGGRLSLGESVPAAVGLAQRLFRKGMSLRRIAERLEQRGFVNEYGRRYNPRSIRAMIEAPARRTARPRLD